MPVVTLTCDLITAMVHALRGNAAEARRHAGYALGLAAMGEGDYPAAFGQLRGLFTEDGEPLHFHLSYLALADLAAAAARAGAGGTVPASAAGLARSP
jgi:hypothetical protein